MSLERLEHILSVVGPVAHQAGEIALDWFGKRSALIVTSKGHHDWVSQADKAVENYIRKALQNVFPQHRVLGEEMGGDYELPCWVVDPIDGTTNFLYGQVDFVISMALVDDQGPAIGIIVAPAHQRSFYAVRGGGAFELTQGQAIALKPRVVANDQLVIGLNLNYRPQVAQHYLQHSQKLIEQGHQIRVSGSAAWTLVQVACGELDGCYMEHVNIWDAMAAQFICQLAGLEVAPYLKGSESGAVWAWPAGSPLEQWINKQSI